MTIASQVSSKTFVATGTAAPVSINFPFALPTDLDVFEVAADGVETLLTLNSHYSISGDGRAIAGVLTEIDCTVGLTHRIERRTELKQTYQPNSGVAGNAKAQEWQLDSLVMAQQDAARDVADVKARAPMVPRGETAPALPALTGQDGKVLGLVGGKFAMVPNDAATAAELVADVEALQGEIEATAEGVEADKLATAADRALAAGHEIDAQAAAAAAADYAANALASLQAALAAGRVFNDETEAYAGTTDGQNLFLREDGNFVEYINDNDTDLIATGIVVAGAATLLATAAAVEAAAGVVGKDTGNGASLGALGGLAPDGYSRRAGMYVDIPAKAAVANRFLSAAEMRARKSWFLYAHSMGAGSGVVGAGAAVKPTSGIAGSFGRKLEQHLKEIDPTHTVLNRSQSAQKSDHIAMRMGAIPVPITLDIGTTLPVATAAPCLTGTTAVGQNGPSAQRNNSPDVYSGNIYGVPCLMKAVDPGSANPKAYTIEQVGGTGDITILPRTPFWIDPPGDSKQGINILWPFQNDNDDVALSKVTARAMVNSLGPTGRYIFMGEIPFATSQDGNPGTVSEDFGTDRWANRMARNAWLQDNFMGNYFDVFGFLTGRWPYDGSIYPDVFHLSQIPRSQSANDYVSTDDWYALGLVAKYLMSVGLGGVDYSHLHEITNWWLSKGLISLFARPKGWL